MVSKEDWAAAMSSEVFREYMSRELHKQAEIVPEVEPQVDDNVYDNLEELQAQINRNPQMLKVFSAIRQRLVENPEFATQIDPNFVRGVLLLDLDD